MFKKARWLLGEDFLMDKIKKYLKKNNENFYDWININFINKLKHYIIDKIIYVDIDKVAKLLNIKNYVKVDSPIGLIKEDNEKYYLYVIKSMEVKFDMNICDFLKILKNLM